MQLATEKAKDDRRGAYCFNQRDSLVHISKRTLFISKLSNHAVLLVGKLYTD